MEIRRVTLETCAEAKGVVVVIDVLRAFTTAAFAFAAGAADITVASTVEEAFVWRDRIPDSMIMGEVGGLPVNGFDLSNSPFDLLGLNLTGRRLIHRSSAGTQGIVRATSADRLVATGLCCARATVGYIMQQLPSPVTMVLTGISAEGMGDEDTACADLIEGLLTGRTPDSDTIIQRVRNSISGRKFSDPARPEFPAEDLECAVDIDRFDFAMVGERHESRIILRPVKLFPG